MIVSADCADLITVYFLGLKLPGIIQWKRAPDVLCDGLSAAGWIFIQSNELKPMAEFKSHAVEHAQ